MNSAPFLSSDELRELTKAGSGVHQIERLKQMGIPFTVDPYETPFVARVDYLKYVLSGSERRDAGEKNRDRSLVEKSASLGSSTKSR